MIDGSRRARIARGSGRQVSDVNSLVDRFFEARKMMTAFASGKMPGTPGMEGLPGFASAAGRRKSAGKGKPAKGRRVSGNPAKAAAQDKARKDKAASTGPNPFAKPGAGEEVDYEKAVAALDLPTDFSKYLK
jgi:signal recognition particle subunit SRP54